MKRVLFTIFMTICFVSTPTSAKQTSPIIKGPEINIIDNNIIVSAHIDNIKRLEETINSGIEKEIIFTIELLRAWMFWPDEFVVSKRIRRYIGYDILRDQYYASWKEKGKLITRYFDDFDKMKSFIFTARGINLMNIKGLEKGKYYVRVIVESKSRQRIRLMGILMYLMPEVEMSLIKESPPFRIGDKK